MLHALRQRHFKPAFVPRRRLAWHRRDASRPTSECRAVSLCQSVARSCRYAASSKPYWPPKIVPPKGAPNILLIMTDDQGYGVSGTFGGVIPTPAMDRIANAGLRYTQFHSTALCSPTRAALITGRNHHSVGFGVITEMSTGYPGYDSVIGPESATIGTILRENGYATAWIGKNHNTPSYQLSSAGPFDQWPNGMGFDHFYGFLGGETDQWTPFLFRDQRHAQGDHNPQRYAARQRRLAAQIRLRPTTQLLIRSLRRRRPVGLVAT
jgi:arylsulfatase A-like enzyme